MVRQVTALSYLTPYLSANTSLADPAPGGNVLPPLQLACPGVEEAVETRRGRHREVGSERAGAFGFTTSRTDSHETSDGELVPSRDADDLELLGIGSALRVTGIGAFGMNSDFDDEEYELRWMRKLAFIGRRAGDWLAAERNDGEDLRGLPLSDRKRRLARLLGGRRLGIVLSDHTDEDGATIFRQACVMGLEGIVSKRLSAPYRSGPSRDWLKVKNPHSPAMTRAREAEW